MAAAQDAEIFSESEPEGLRKNIGKMSARITEMLGHGPDVQRKQKRVLQIQQDITRKIRGRAAFHGLQFEKIGQDPHDGIGIALAQNCIFLRGSDELLQTMEQLILRRQFGRDALKAVGAQQLLKEGDGLHGHREHDGTGGVFRLVIMQGIAWTEQKLVRIQRMFLAVYPAHQLPGKNVSQFDAAVKMRGTDIVLRIPTIHVRHIVAHRLV